MQDYIFLELLVTHFLPHVSHTKGSELTQFSSKRENEVYNTIKSAKKKAKVAIVAAKKKKKKLYAYTHTHKSKLHRQGKAFQKYYGVTLALICHGYSTVIFFYIEWIFIDLR